MDRISTTFVLVALYFQQVLAMPPEQAGFAMVPTSLTGCAVSWRALPRVLGAIGISSGSPVEGALVASGLFAASTAAAIVALPTAALGARSRDLAPDPVHPAM